jgi:hypothetical protein
MIVGLSTATTRKEAPAMAGADRMTIEEVVKRVLHWYRSGIDRTMTENLHGIA